MYKRGRRNKGTPRKVQLNKGHEGKPGPEIKGR